MLDRQTDMEALFIKLDDIIERSGGPVVEIRCARRQPAQDRSFRLADIGAFAGDHRATDVRHLEDLTGKRPAVHQTVNTGSPERSSTGGAAAPAFATPMFSGAFTEWLPEFGVSWQVPQNPGMFG